MIKTNEKKIRKIYESNIKIEDYFRKINDNMSNADVPPLSASSNNPHEDICVQYTFYLFILTHCHNQQTNKNRELRV